VNQYNVTPEDLAKELAKVIVEKTKFECIDDYRIATERALLKALNEE
jgi:hypothetical protein